MTEHPMIEAARRGLHVFPCAPGSKIPNGRIRWGEIASRDIGQVRRWAQISPSCNYGVACKPSGLIVVDCDTDKGAPAPDFFSRRFGGRPVDGDDLLAGICVELGARLQRTLEVSTPGGGRHYYYRWPPGVAASQSPLAAGWIDVRTCAGRYGGYVIGPGSVIGGRPYRVVNRAQIAPAPEWLVEMCTARVIEPRVRHPIFAQPGTARSGGAKPGNAGAMAAFAHAQEGNRNAALHWAACVLADDDYTIDQVVDMALDSNPGLGVAEIRATVRSAFRTVGRA